jgi:ComF family protein
VDHPTRGPLCSACWRAVPRHAEPACLCGDPRTLGDERCRRCRRALTPFARGASLGPYEGTLRVLVHELKYRGRRRVGDRLAEEILSTPEARAVARGADVLVPVPLHPRREKERGFNQSELLARGVAGRTGLPVARALVRRVDTPPQTGLSAARRRANVAAAFAVRRRAQVAGRVVVLVDDVRTTGATVRACASALLAAGAAEVRLLTAARVD